MLKTGRRKWGPPPSLHPDAYKLREPSLSLNSKVLLLKPFLDITWRYSTLTIRESKEIEHEASVVKREGRSKERFGTDAIDEVRMIEKCKIMTYE